MRPVGYDERGQHRGVVSPSVECVEKGEQSVELRLEEVVPWGRSASEYTAMFALTPQNLDARLLDCGGGPSSFTAELSAQGRRVTACDPLYAFSAAQIGRRIVATARRMTALTETSKDRFHWDSYESPRHLAHLRLRTMRRFLDDYSDGRAQGRYVEGALPTLPFAAESFDVALCSHLLFTYSVQLTTAFHVASLLELVRVAREVRVFPLLTAFAGELSPHLAPVLESLRTHGCAVEVRPVGYEFQKGGNQMLCVSADPV